jgi:4-amino-4-deoxy-L-arabinose transferase-like glycosyltransferase
MPAQRVSRIFLLLVCLLAFALRLGPAFDNRFHPDEALFSSWALKIAHGENVLLTGLPIDKPPLLIYTTAISFLFFGQTEIAARLPNLIASVISVLLVYQLSKGRGDWPIAPTIFALSPFAILFAPTAFLDPMMIMFGLASLVAASRNRLGWAGILLGLAFATKVEGLFFLPLVPIFMESVTWSARNLVTKKLVRFLAGVIALLVLVVIWDRLRGGLPFWVQQSINYGGIRLIYPSEVGPRLIGWLSFLPYFFGSIVGAIGLIGLPIVLWLDLTRFARSRDALIDLMLIAYLIAFIALHWLLAFQVWDRYLLLIVPIASILLARIITRVFQFVSLSRHLAISLSLLLSIGLLPFAVAASKSQYAIGGDHGASDGIDQVAAYLKALPSGTVVYDHWLAWELDYYLGEGYIYLAYFDTPAALADDLYVFDRGEDRYVIFPARESIDKTVEAIQPIGFQLTPVYSTINRFNQTSFTIYKIIPLSH